MSEVRRRARRCPMCGTVNRPTAQSCECGHHFDDIAESRDLLRSRVASGWTMVVLGVVCAIGAVFLFLILPWIGFLMIGPSVALFVKGTRVVDAARSGLRQLEGIPVARLIKEGE